MEQHFLMKAALFPFVAELDTTEQLTLDCTEWLLLICVKG